MEIHAFLGSGHAVPRLFQPAGLSVQACLQHALRPNKCIGCSPSNAEEDGMQARMQQGMLADQGQAFNSMFNRDETSNELVVTKCPYSEVLRAEGKPHLLAVCCCSQDASWCVRLASVFICDRCDVFQALHIAKQP
jgi:hypothetical protein